MSPSRTPTASRPPLRRRGEVPPEMERPLDVRRIVRVTLAVIGVVAIAIAVWIFLPDSATYGGPLQPELTGISNTGAKRGVGKSITVGLFLPWNVGDENAVLDGLVPLSPSEGIEIVGSGVLPPAASAIGAVGGWPPEGMREPPPVPGFAIPPGQGSLDAYQILVGVRATGLGVHTIPGFEIRYHVGGTDHRAVLIQGIWICVPREEKPACPGKDGIEEQQRELLASLQPLVDAPSR